MVGKKLDSRGIAMLGRVPKSLVLRNAITRGFALALLHRADVDDGGGKGFLVSDPELSMSITGPADNRDWK